MEEYLVFIIIAIIIILGIAATLYQKHQAQLRTAALQEIAPQLGLDFRAEPSTIPAAIREMVQGSGRKQFHNHLYGRRDDYQLHLFDYSYTVSTGKSSHTVTQTVIAVDLISSGLHLPKFMVRPWRMGDHIKKEWLGYDFIDLPTKYKEHVLIGFEDKLDLQMMVDEVPATLWHSLPAKSYWISDGNWFVCYSNGKRLEATFNALEQAIFVVLDNGYQLSLGRVKSSKIRL